VLHAKLLASVPDVSKALSRVEISVLPAVPTVTHAPVPVPVVHAILDFIWPEDLHAHHASVAVIIVPMASAALIVWAITTRPVTTNATLAVQNVQHVMQAIHVLHATLGTSCPVVSVLPAVHSVPLVHPMLPVIHVRLDNSWQAPNVQFALLTADLVSMQLHVVHVTLATISLLLLVNAQHVPPFHTALLAVIQLLAQHAILAGV
jgi:hypothetical protein